MAMTNRENDYQIDALLQDLDGWKMADGFSHKINKGKRKKKKKYCHQPCDVDANSEWGPNWPIPSTHTIS